MVETRKLPGYENKYLIDEYGNLYSIPSKRSIYSSPQKLKPQPTIWGYKQFTLTGGKRYRVHQLVAMTFLSAKPSHKHQIDHVDGDKSNNHYLNLRWVTAKENINAAKQNGLLNPPIGERCAMHKLKEKDVLYMRSMKGRITQKKLAEIYNMDPSTISNIMTGKTWNYLGGIA